MTDRARSLQEQSIARDFESIEALDSAERSVTKAIRFYETGGPDVLKWENVEVGSPGPGQVRLRHTAVAVNYRDILVRNGGHQVATLPSGLGLEAAGVVEALGADVTDLSIGDRVVCVAGPDSAYAEARIVPAQRVVRIPDTVSDRIAAAMMIRGMTARYLVRQTYRVQKGDWILVHAAAGGVGTILCQWAKHLGANVIGTVGSSEKIAVARARGCDHVINYATGGFVDEVLALTGNRGVDVVYDSVGRATFEQSLRSLRRRGVLASFGEASGDPDPIAPRRLGQLGSLFLTHPSLPDYTATRAALLESANELFDMVVAGKIHIEVTAEYPLRDAARAHADMESRKTVGAVVLVV
jgi:NADPH2:quinone reductase